jgi:Tfp pilus assembly protein PilP
MTMNRYSNLVQKGRLLVAAMFIFLSINNLSAGDRQGTPPPTDKPAAVAGEANKTAAPTLTDVELPAKNIARSNVRDPFVVPTRVIKPPVVIKLPKPVPPAPQPIPAANVAARFSAYKDLLRSSISGQNPEPSKLAPYLIEELTISGIFKTEEGFGAFITETATDKQQTIFARVGWSTHDGIIEDITPNGVKFKKIIKYNNGTVKQTEEFRAFPLPNSK